MARSPRTPKEFLEEIQRRQVVKAFVIWLTVAFFTKELLDTFGPAFGLGEEAMPLVGFLLLLLLPVFVGGAWVFDVDGRGLHLEDGDGDGRADDDGAPSPSRGSGWASPALALGLMVMVGLYLADVGGMKSATRGALAGLGVGAPPIPPVAVVGGDSAGPEPQHEPALVDPLTVQLDSDYEIAAAPEDGEVPVRFSRPVDPLTVTERSLRLLDAGGREVRSELVCCSDSLRLARLVPSEPLDRGAAYTVAVSNLITAADGAGLTPIQLSFETRRPPPAPGAGAPLNGRVSPPPRPSGPGRLTVRPSPSEVGDFDLTILVDGREAGKGRVEGLQVAENAVHRVEITASQSFSSYSMTVFDETLEVTPGQQIDLDARIVPFGAVDITSAPDGVEVFVDGERVGRTPLVGFLLTAGIHRLELRPGEEHQDAFGPVSEQFRVEPFQFRALPRISLPGKGAALIGTPDPKPF